MEKNTSNSSTQIVITIFAEKIGVRSQMQNIVVGDNLGRGKKINK